MHRTRNESRWRFTHHPSIAGFLNGPAPAGAHSITHGTQYIDLLIEDRGSSTTLVVFHGSLSNNVKHLPVLQGGGIAKSARVNLVSLSDPSLGMGDIDLAWFIGNRDIGWLRPLLSPIIQHAIESLGSSRTILFGSSGGGYAAVNFAQDFPDCIVLTVNPRLDLSARPRARVNEYLTICHRAYSKTPMARIKQSFITENIVDTVPDKLPYDMLLFQNTGDRIYLREQATPFVERLKNDPRLYVRLEHTGIGHTPIPKTTLQSIVVALSSCDDQTESISQAGFQQHALRMDPPDGAVPH